MEINNKSILIYYSLILYTILIIITSCNNNSSEKKNSTHHPKKDSVEIVQPPIIHPEPYDTSLWLDIEDLNSEIVIDMRYATDNNFVGEIIYDCGKCFLRPQIAKALIKVHEDAKELGLGGLKIFDCYRPRPYQQKLWDIVPDPRFVSPPNKGSMHGRGAAVDLTLVDTDGKELDMGTDFDHFGKEAYHGYSKFNDTIVNNRILLKNLMYKRGFKHIRTEWWHYSYVLKNYSLSDWVWGCNTIQ